MDALLSETRDGGETWQSPSLTPSSGATTATYALPSPGDGDALFVAGILFSNGTYQLSRSSDGGQTWTVVDQADTASVANSSGSHFPDVVLSGGDFLAFSLSDKVAYRYHSGDTGFKTFAVTGLGDPQAVSFADDQHGWALSTQSGVNALVKTADGGQTWSWLQLPATPSAAVVATATPTPGFATPPAGVANVRAMQLVNLGFAWILTDSQLTSTEFIPAGETISIQTKDITPPGVGIADVRGVSFLDSVHGWLVANGPTDSSNTAQLMVYRTSDGGYSWRSSPVGEPDLINAASASMPAYIDFLDGDTGWVVAKTVSGTAFSVGDLYRTDDGGATWAKLSIPTGDPVYFADASNGWAAGGPVRDKLYVTHDGGSSWNDASDVTPLSEPSGPRALGLPMAVNGGAQLLLPVTIANTGLPSVFILYSSTDGGQSWRQVADGSPIEGDGALLSFIFPNGRVVAIAQNGGTGLVLPAGSTGLLKFTVAGLVGAIDIQFADDKHGWALVNESLCASFKTNCWSLNRIEQTDDGGITWGPP